MNQKYDFVNTFEVKEEKNEKKVKTGSKRKAPNQSEVFQAGRRAGQEAKAKVRKTLQIKN